MSKIGTFIGLKAAGELGDEAAADRQRSEKAEKNIIELDNDLFLPVASQLGEANEGVRNLLIDVEHKIGELETIKRSIVALVDPVNKTLRALEEAKAEKISLHASLNNTRITNNKLRTNLDNAERKVATLESESSRLRESVTVAQQKMSAYETTRAEQTTELNARRAQVADLQRRLQQQAADLEIARDEYRRLSERMTLTDKRAVQLESDGDAVRQRFLLTDKERATLQTAVEKANAEITMLSQRLLDTDKNLAATQIRLQKTEMNLGETQAERHRLAANLDDINQRHQNEVNSHKTNHETLQARALLTDKMLDEARQSLTERAEEIRAFDRRLADLTRMHSVIGEKLGLIETTLSERTSKIKELEQARATLAEQNDMLTKSVATRENAYNRAQEHIQALEERIQLLESEVKATRQSNDTEIEILNAKLQREQISRTMAEGAVEAGRKDITRLVQELATLQYRPAAQTSVAEIETPAQAEEPERQPSGSSSAQAA